jgi:hypothetical protein
MLIFSYGFPKAFKSFLAVLFCSKKVLTCLHQKLCNFQSESLLLSQSSKVSWTKPTVYSLTPYGAYLEKLIHPSQSKPISTFDTDLEYYLRVHKGFSCTLFVGFFKHGLSWKLFFQTESQEKRMRHDTTIFCLVNFKCEGYYDSLTLWCNMVFRMAKNLASRQMCEINYVI